MLMILKRIGLGKIRIGVVGCLHGNELLGKKVIDLLDPIEEMELITLVVNTPAMREEKRFIETDLNRSFPGDITGTLEERLAVKILHQLRYCKYVIDIHSTTAETEEFIVATKEIDLIEKIPLRKIVFMQKLSQGKALIDHVPGVSLEFNERTEPNTVVSIIKQTLENVKKKKQSLLKEKYLIDLIVPGNEIVQNFSLMKKWAKIGTFIVKKESYPILSGEKAYKDVSCILCRRI